MDKTPEERLRALASDTRTSLLEADLYFPSDSATITAELFGQNDIRFHSCKLTDGFRMALQDAESRFRYIHPAISTHTQPPQNTPSYEYTHPASVHTTNPQHAPSNQGIPGCQYANPAVSIPHYVIALVAIIMSRLETDSKYYPMYGL